MKIRTWWLNRALLYWIPVIFVYDLPTTISRFGITSALMNALVAVVIALFFEHYLFNYKVDLSADTLRYSHGLIGNNIHLNRASIIRACFLPTPLLAKLTSSRLLLKTGDGGEYVLSLASFRPADVFEIIKWLPIEPERNL